MIGNRKDSEKNPKRADLNKRDSAVTILTSGCHFKGKLYCRGSTRVGGRIEGEIFSEGLLIIEEEAVIQANIRADETVLQGKVKGVLEASGRVELCSTCKFVGDILTPTLIIREGASFNGSASMTLEPMADVVETTTHNEFFSPDVIQDSARNDLNNVTHLKGPEVKVTI